MPWTYRRCWIWDALFAHRRWYRRWCGGHWEQWWNDVTRSMMWFEMDRCSINKDGVGNYYRPPCCFGRPTCEDH